MLFLSQLDKDLDTLATYSSHLCIKGKNKIGIYCHLIVDFDKIFTEMFLEWSLYQTYIFVVTKFLISRRDKCYASKTRSVLYGIGHAWDIAGTSPYKRNPKFAPYV